MKRIDILITASLRHELHKRVLENLNKNLITQRNIRLIINVDPIGLPDETQNLIINNYKNYHSDIIYNLSNNPNFFKSFCWVLNNSETDFVLNLEDDWIFNDKLYLDDLISIMMKYNIDTYELFLNAKRRKGLKRKDFHSFDQFKYITATPKIFPGPPAIYKRTYVDKLRQTMNENYKKDWKNLMDFYKKTSFKKILNNLNQVIYNYKDNGNIVKDIGRKWKRENQIVLAQKRNR